jgi:hypothetical protein
MKIETAINDCHDWLKANVSRAPELLEELYRRQTDLDISYQDRPIPTFLRPCFITAKQRAMIRESSQVLLNCAERLIGEYGNDPTIREGLGLSPEEEEFALMPSGLRRQVVVARPDSFLNGDKLKFLEFNSDSPAGVAWTDLHEDVFLELPVLKDQPWVKSLGRTDCQRLLLEAFLEAFEVFGLNQPPVMAIVDWREVATSREFYVVQKYLGEHGIKAVVADPHEFELRGDTLYAAGTAVNLVYRRVIIGEVIKKRDEPGVKDFLEAYRRRLVCVVNPFCAKLSGSKAFMALLSDDRHAGLFTRRQNQVRRQFVPWTRVLKKSKVSFEEQKADVFELAAREQERMVIKPTHGYGGKGVVVGKETESGKWRELVNQAASKPGEWTMQEYVEIPEEPFPILDPDLRFENLKVNLNPYLFGGKYAGSFVRLSKSSIINVSAGGGMVPAFVLT